MEGLPSGWQIPKSWVTNLDIGLAHAALGRRVFPFRLTNTGGHRNKVPIVKWKEAATTDEATIRKWGRSYPTARYGWVLDEGLVVVDIDDPTTFADSGLDLPVTASQATPSGGSHHVYSGIGVKQTVKVHPGIDTRVGGKGWVGLYSLDSFNDAPIVDAPSWLLDPIGPKEVKEPTADAPLTTRSDILEIIGRWRWAGVTESQILSGLLEMYADGRITESDANRPWTKADFETLAKDIGAKPQGKHESIKTPTVTKIKKVHQIERITAAELRAKDLPPLQFIVPGFLVQGTTLLSAAPKIGKSWMVYQLAYAIALGREFLGEKVQQGQVLYYALEDGEGPFQNRSKKVLAEQYDRVSNKDLANLEIRWNAPLSGSGLEEEIEEWLSSQSNPRMVAIDTVSRVKPKHLGNRNQYDLDMGDFGNLQSMFKGKDISLLLVHHTKKGKTDDPLEKVSGSFGVTGSVDVSITVARDRHEEIGEIDIISRHMEDRRLYARFNVDEGIWTEAEHGPLSEEQEEILEIVKEHGPISVSEILTTLGEEETSARRVNTGKKLTKLKQQGLVLNISGKWVSTRENINNIKVPVVPYTTTTTDTTDTTDDTIVPVVPVVPIQKKRRNIVQ